MSRANTRAGSTPTGETQGRVLLIVAFFGRFPVWMPAFLLSCAYNPKIEWLIYTDGTPPAHHPDNVRFGHLTLDGFNERASDALRMRVQLHPDFIYKICDLRPAYGEIFAEEFAPYEFWGHCDVDLVWGRWDGFVTDRMLDRFDIIGSRPNKISGHLSLYRNEAWINSLYRDIPGLREKVTSPEHHRMGEKGITRLLRERRTRLPHRMHQLVRPRRKLARPRIYWRRHLTTKGAEQLAAIESGRPFVWRQGRTYDAEGHERMYLHFHRFKRTMTAINFDLDDPPGEFRITPEGMFA